MADSGAGIGARAGEPTIGGEADNYRAVANHIDVAILIAANGSLCMGHKLESGSGVHFGVLLVFS